MKLIPASVAVAAAVLVLSACSSPQQADGSASDAASSARSSTASSEPTPTPAPDLTGEWKQNNTKSDDGWTSATITGSTITVEFVTDNGDTRSLFWVGTFTPPADSRQPYTWSSARDKAATENALLASTDDTKDFTFDDGELSFPVSIQGTSTTVRMSHER